VTFAHRLQWAYGFAAGVTTLVYVAWLGIQLSHTPAAEIDFVPALLWTLLASFIIHSLGRGAVMGARAKSRVSDERDRAVTVRGDALSFYVFSVMAAVPLLLGLLEVEPFWITNTLFLAFAAAAVFGVIAKTVLYTKGA